MLVTFVAVIFIASCASAAPREGFKADDYHFLDVFGTMLRGSHLPVSDDRYGGSKCAGCTILLVLVESLAAVHKSSVEDEIDKLCSRLPIIVREPCDEFVKDFGPIIVNMLEKKETADAVCLAIDFCGGGAPGPVCRMLNAPDDLHREQQAVAEARAMKRQRTTPLALKAKGSKKGSKKRFETPWKWLLDKLEYTFNKHVPLDDFDNDTFSTIHEFRGTSWRGRDCDDLNRDIRPGVNSAGRDATVDWNCNGVYGVNPATGKSREEELCGSTPQYGVAYIGDSAGAHFHIPPSFMNASMIQEDTFHDLVPILANEFDWPQMSTGTGYENSTWMGSPIATGYGENSFYQHFLRRNRCAHRDYQNICVNGARVASIADSIIQSFRRNQTADLPMVVGFALIGNDVCNGHHSYDTMTTPAEFKAAVLRSLDYLETVLPNGSHVITYGLATGSVLYDTMHDRTHPLGNNFPEINYERVYDYLNCLGVNPCWGWLNSNATVRNYTDHHAALLSGIYDEIIQEYGSSGRWSHFDLHYFSLDFQEIIDQWQQMGGQTWQLIEPIDGFHPSQIGMTLLAARDVARFEKFAPGVMPPINPNNDLIQQLFGDQGGY